MPEREEDWAGNVSYKANDGSSHHSEYDANQHESNRAADFAKSMSGGGGGSDWMSNLFLKIIFVLPVLCAKAAGFIFALLSKLGIVGRVLQTIFVSMICPMIALIIVMVLFGDNVHKVPGFVIAGIMSASFIIPAIWYFIWHYHTVKQIGASEYSNVIKASFVIAFFGYIIAVIVGMVGAAGFGVFLTLGVTFAVFFLYFRAVKPYSEAAKDMINVSPRAKLVWLIGLAVVAGITVLTAIGEGIDAIGDAINKSKNQNEVTAPRTPGEE